MFNIKDPRNQVKYLLFYLKYFSKIGIGMCVQITKVYNQSEYCNVVDGAYIS